MKTLMIEQFTCRQDNFGVLIHDPMTGETAAIDAPDGHEVARQIERTGWGLTHLLITHHHPDHVEGIEHLKAIYGPKVIGPKSEADKIGGLDET